ncbi:tripartite tricarboxylate transporter TctB family protein [Chelativorans sp. ZYF759]|uniref:tripartite tricarboxylate transporter TctB family protein n=1 Tax=Chelativorans sp. ZYF759 TaxID=2692213 RepID=UPI001AEE08DE|nr:tripartite tricarboxylate transporter TctB family protein [Chelativorans sp. ZYF759]
MMSKKLQLEFLAAAVLMVFGAMVAMIAAGYPQGTLLRPGSGLVPLALGCLIVFLGVAIMVEARLGRRKAEEAEDTDEVPGLRQVIAVGAVSIGMIAFALLVERAGFIPATIVLIMLSGLGEARIRWLSLFALAIAMSAAGVAIFIWGFNLPLAAFGAIR